MLEIRRIKRHRHLSKAVKKAGETREELKSIKRKEENVREHSKGKMARQSKREKMILGIKK
jgi:WD repeat and SOF domain-containing protein 1